MQESTHPEDGVPSASAGDASAGAKRAPSSGATGEPAVGNRGLGETELDTALQLLVERAQYITGATGTAWGEWGREELGTLRLGYIPSGFDKWSMESAPP